jgi:hypothetical protein
MKDKIVIDLNEAKLLTESPSLVKFGAKLKQMLYYMFAPTGASFREFFTIKGNPKDVQALAAVVASEKKYMDSFLKNGLNDPVVLNSRYTLEKSVRNFEQETGIKWPLK